MVKRFLTLQVLKLIIRENLKFGKIVTYRITSGVTKYTVETKIISIFKKKIRRISPKFK